MWNRFLPAIEKTWLHTGLYGERNIGRGAPDVPLPPNYITAVSFRRSVATEKSILSFVINLLQKFVIGRSVATERSVQQHGLQLITITCH